jgi:hypothetical protein
LINVFATHASEAAKTRAFHDIARRREERGEERSTGIVVNRKAKKNFNEDARCGHRRG